MADLPALPQPGHAHGDTVVIDSWDAAVKHARGEQDTLDKLLEIGSSFDWFTPLGALVHQFFFGGVGFTVPDVGAGSLFDDLTGRGVRWRWRDLRRGFWLFNVPGAQAEYTCYLLDRAGLFYRHSPIPRRFRKGSRGGRKSSTRGTLFDRIKSELFN